MPSLAEIKMKALSLEKSEDWNAAALAWHDAIGSIKDAAGSLIAVVRDEMRARAAAAEARADEPNGYVQPLHKLESHAEAEQKTDEDRVPEPVEHLPAGETQGSTGAR